MAKINIQEDIRILQDGIIYPAKLNAIRMVDLEELKFKKNYTTHNDRYFITPENLMAMNQVFDLFPTEKWKYTFFTTAEKVNSKKPERPYLWAMVSNGVNSVYLKFTRMTEREYNYLRALYMEMFPNGKFLSVEAWQKKMLDEELLHPVTVGQPTGSGLSEVLSALSSKQYNAVRDMIFGMRNEYITGVDGTEFDYFHLTKVINREFVNAIVRMAASVMPPKYSGNTFNFEHPVYRFKDALNRALVRVDGPTAIEFEAPGDVRGQVCGNSEAEIIKAWKKFSDKNGLRDAVYSVSVELPAEYVRKRRELEKLALTVLNAVDTSERDQDEIENVLYKAEEILMNAGIPAILPSVYEDENATYVALFKEKLPEPTFYSGSFAIENWTPVRKAVRGLLAAMAYTEKMTRAAKEYVKMDEDGNIDFNRGIGAALCCRLEWEIKKM